MMATSSGSFWAKGLFLLAVTCNAAWVVSGATGWSALLVIGGGFAAIISGFLMFADVRGAGAVSYRDYVRWHKHSPFRNRYWENPRRNYKWSGAVALLLGITMIVIGFWRFVESL